MQRVIAFAGLLEDPLALGLLANALRLGARQRVLFGLQRFAPLFFRAGTCLFVRDRRAPLLLFRALAVLGGTLLGLCALALGGRHSLAFLVLGLLSRRACVFLRASDGVDLFLLLAGLLLQHVALDIGALLADLHVHRSGAPLPARQLQLALRLAVQRDAARRRIAGIFAAMRLAQMRQQLELGVLADDVLPAVDLDARLIELLDESIDRHLQYLREFCDRHFRHLRVYLGRYACVSCSNQ